MFLRPATPSSRPQFAGALVLLALGAATFVAREPHALDSVYSEDGAIFLPQALDRGPLSSLTTTYAGYLHLAPRLIAEVVAALPVRHAAVAYAVLSALVTAALALLVYRAVEPHVPSVSVRRLLAAGVVLLPLAQEEYLANVANLHWPLLFAAFVVLLWQPSTRWELAVGAVVVALAVLSDPLAIALIPLALWRLLAVEERRQQVVTAAFVLSAIPQCAVVLTHLEDRVLVGELQAESVGLSPNPIRSSAHFVTQVLGRGVAGSRFVDDSRSAVKAVALLAAAGALLAIAYIAYRRRGRASLALASVALAFSFGLYVLGESSADGAAPPRYSIVPVLLLFLAIAVVLGGEPRAGERFGGPAVWAVVLVAAVIWGSNFNVPTVRDRLESWSAETARARARCKELPTDADVTFPFFIGLTTTLPCSSVLGS